MKICASTIRLEFIQDYTLKSLRLKQDKWNKLVISDEQRGFLHSFVDQGFPQELVISQNIGGQLQVHTDWPSPLKNKGVFFVKREKEPLPENVDELLDHMVCGDIHPNALDQFCALVEEVVVPLFKNELNMDKFPKCVADDIKRQVHELATSVYQIRGHIKGRTLLPFPQGASLIDDEEKKVRESDGRYCNMLLKNNIEGIILKWSHQTDEVLTKDSAAELEGGDNPGPMTEIKFWDAKCVNLESLFEQMKANTTKNMASILNVTDSAYYPCFRSMFRNVVAALNESLDICLHLKPLRDHFEAMSDVEFTDIRPLFPPLMHTVCLVYSHSTYYSSAARIIVLMTETCNLLIDMARTYLDPSTIFQIEVEEALDKVNISIRNLKEFRTTFQHFKSIVPTYFTEEKTPKTWEFQEHLIFHRFDEFLERLNIIREFFLTAQQFLKLEKVEIGGIRGKALTTSIKKVSDEFKDLYGVFTNRTYDSLDPKDEGFLKDNEKFQNKIFSLDRKLGAILIRAFDDCVVTESIFKLLNIFGSLIDRKLIALELNDKMPHLVTKLQDEMDEAKTIFLKQSRRINDDGKALIDRNMPPISGQLKFAKELRDKIARGMKNFRDLDHNIVTTEGGETVVEKYKEMVGLLTCYEERLFERWILSVDQKIGNGLAMPLLVRNPDKTLKVNFGQDTLSILNEVKHLKKEFPQRSVTEKAKEIFKRFDEFRNYNNSLEQMVNLYNYLHTKTVPQEQALISEELSELDELMEPAEQTLTWNSEAISPYVERLRSSVAKLNTRVRKAQDNITKIKETISVWEHHPLFERIKDPKKEPLFSMDDREEKKSKRYREIQEASLRIETILAENEKLYKVDFTSKQAKKHWESYLNYLDKMVAEGLLRTIAVSLGYLLDETDEKKDISVLFSVSLCLCEPDVIFKPSLDVKMAVNFRDICESILDDIFTMAELVPRISNAESDYLDFIKQHKEIMSLRSDFMARVDLSIERANIKRNTFLDYSYLWTESRSDYMYYFLNYGRQLTEEELLKLDEDEIAKKETIKKEPPTLLQFQEQINHYEAIYEEVKQIECTKVFNLWFRADITPFKTSLLNCVKRWSYAFKKHLLDHVVNSLKDLNDFIEVADEGLMVSVQEGDYAGLINVMEFLQRVKERQATTDTMFEPLKEVIEVLKNYGVVIPEESMVQLQELPERWANTKRLSISAKQHVAPLQGIEIGRLKARIDEYDKMQKTFRTRFTGMRFYFYTCKSPYDHLTEANKMIDDKEEKIKELQSQATLFEVAVPNFPLMEKCRKENKMLKQLWDYIFLVRTSIDEWKTTAWVDIDVENMDMECKKFAKDIRGLDKEMRGWNAFIGLELTVKNMLTSLRAVGELQNPAIRERHWEQLVQATRVQFIMSDETTLADLLSLNLHNFEDEVHNIVDKACKEMAMEKMLKDLDTTWKTMEFEHENHPRTGYNLLRASEELIETLEENQVQLQNMMTSKFIGFFLKEISTWQKTLGVVDQVITTWFDVQRTWSYLESIFIGSEDIRKQLPEDSDRFDKIDTEFKGLMKETSKTKNVIEATNVPGLVEQLEVIQSQLTLCEKALAEYLETKRLAFPRFYFASSADLLDILSNGNQPLLVAKHLTKLFDSMAKLKMGEGAEANLAVQMTSKDGETVNFTVSCLCEGQVEVWLNRLMDAMRSTIRSEFEKSMGTYEDAMRDQWLFDYPAQVALAGTQIFWSLEVSNSFAKLEEGYENALKDYYKKQINQLNSLITLLLGSLTKGERQKVMTICTIDVHSRDVVSKMIIPSSSSPSSSSSSPSSPSSSSSPSSLS